MFLRRVARRIFVSTLQVFFFFLRSERQMIPPNNEEKWSASLRHTVQRSPFCWQRQHAHNLCDRENIFSIPLESAYLPFPTASCVVAPLPFTMYRPLLLTTSMPRKPIFLAAVSLPLFPLLVANLSRLLWPVQHSGKMQFLFRFFAREQTAEISTIDRISLLL